MTASERLLLTHCLRVCLSLSFRFGAMLCSNFGNENFDAAISNVHAGSICPAGHTFATPDLGILRDFFTYICQFKQMCSKLSTSLKKII